jgi:hypothetical protein
MYAVKKSNWPLRHTSQHHHDCIGLLLHVHKQHTSRKLPALLVCKYQFPGSGYSHTEKLPGSSKTFACCTPTTRHMAAQALPRLRLVAQLPAARLHRLYCTYDVHPDTARLLFGRWHWLSRRARSLRLAARLLAARLHRLYCAYVVHPGAPSRRSTSRRSVVLAVVVHPVNPSCAATTHLLAATGLPQLCRASGCLATWHG